MSIFKSSRFVGYVIIWLLQDSVFAADDSTRREQVLSQYDKFLTQEFPSVYEASKYEQQVTPPPASMGIVTADEIKKYGYRTFGDIISSLKGFYNTNDRNYFIIAKKSTRL